jgi:hypothetical protein
VDRDDGQFLVIEHSHRNVAATSAITRALITRIGQTLLDKPNSPTPHTWFVLDELQSIVAARAGSSGRLDILGDLFSKGRSKGLVPVVGYQSLPSLREICGPDGAAAISSYSAFKVFGAMNDWPTAEDASQLFGERYVIDVLGSESRDAKGDVTRSEAEHIRKERVVPPEVFLNMQPLQPPFKNNLEFMVKSPVHGSYFYDRLTIDAIRKLFEGYDGDAPQDDEPSDHPPDEPSGDDDGFADLLME